MSHVALALYSALAALAGCALSPDDSADPCNGVELPACPEACPDDYAATCGEACTVEGETCGNDIGDGRQCLEGIYQCSVHAPLGGPGECNLVCRD